MKFRSLLCSLIVLAGGLITTTALAAEPKPISTEQFDTLHRTIKPQAGENRHWEIPWHLSIWEARQQAAAEGKPIFIWSGSQGAPIAGC